MKIYKIAKVTSEDCVAWLIQNKFPNTQPSEWKRRSKKRDGNVIVRTFENVVSGQIGEVYEGNGTIVPTPSVGSPVFSITPSAPKQNIASPKSKIVYGWATVRTPDSEEDLDGYLVVAPRGHYDSDDFDEEADIAISTILINNGFVRSDETNIDIPRGKKAQLQTLLNTDPQLKSLLQYDAGFQKFLSEQEHGPYDFEYDKSASGSPKPSISPKTKVANKVYYVIATSNMDVVGNPNTNGEQSTLLYVTDAKVFDEEGCQSDFTPPAAFKELKKLGYRGDELMESVLEIQPISGAKTYDFAKIDEWANEVLQGAPVNMEDFKQKLASSSVFQFNPAFFQFMQSHGGEEGEQLIPM